MWRLDIDAELNFKNRSSFNWVSLSKKEFIFFAWWQSIILRAIIFELFIFNRTISMKTIDARLITIITISRWFHWIKNQIHRKLLSCIVLILCNQIEMCDDKSCVTSFNYNIWVLDVISNVPDFLTPNVTHNNSSNGLVCFNVFN